MIAWKEKSQAEKIFSGSRFAEPKIKTKKKKKTGALYDDVSDLFFLGR